MGILISLTALILSIVALRKISNIKKQVSEMIWKDTVAKAKKDSAAASRPPQSRPVKVPPVQKPEKFVHIKPRPESRPAKVSPVQKPEKLVHIKPEISKPPIKTFASKAVQEPSYASPVKTETKPLPIAKPVETLKQPPKKRTSLEQQIGTRWVLIAGIIATFFGVAFFMKHAYDNFSIGPLGRVICVTVAGLAALITGEITRRRGYDIVAKGVTALGFAILYTAAFSAHRFYDLIGTVPAFALAIIITACAMAYAVKLNEILIAFLSLLGGFLTPVIVSTGENRPGLLFSYVLILSIGAMACASYRKWRTVNLVAFIGTFLMFTGWFETFYESVILDDVLHEPQMKTAISWLCVFFLIYLILPVIFELIKKVKAKKEDVLLIFFNASVTFYFLWQILHENHRYALASSAVFLCAAHLSLMLISFIRNAEDSNLRKTLLTIGLFFLTIALPLYFKMHALTIAWSAQAVLLAVIGLRYRSILTQFSAVIAFLLSCINLFRTLPMHTGEFRFIINPVFGTWCFVAAAACVYHLVYRYAKDLEEEEKNIIAQALYAAMGCIAFIGSSVEWYTNCRYNLSSANPASGQFMVFTGFLLLFLIRPLCPKGRTTGFFRGLAVLAGSLYVIAMSIDGIHSEQFKVFLNADFGAALVFIAALGTYHVICRRNSKSPDDKEGIKAQSLFCIAGLVMFAVATMEWYWHCEMNLSIPSSISIISQGQMVIFAAILMLFMLRPLCPAGRIAEAASLWTIALGSVFTVVALTQLHRGTFTIFLNPNFITVIVFLAVMLACHIKYRRTSTGTEQPSVASQVIYAVLGILLMLTLIAEWCWHCHYNIGSTNTAPAILKGQIVAVALTMLLFSCRPICPKGVIPRIMAAAIAMVGSLYTLVAVCYIYDDSFTIFLNHEFAIAILFVAALFMSGRLLAKSRDQQPYDMKLPPTIYMMGVFVLLILLTEEVYLYWMCLNKYAAQQPNWYFLAHMYISVTWAVYGTVLMVIGFWKNKPLLRYTSLGLFAILLAKVFIIDTSEVENVYRIAAFMATGITLVGISYLYQFLKKKGFFDALLAETTDKSSEE